MNRLIFVFLLLSALLATTAFSQGSSAAKSLPNPWPLDFPVPPKTENSLFFIQRNRNKNTIIYDARRLDNGNFHHFKPIDVYWMRYGSTGERAELTWLQRTFAFGYNAKKDPSGKSFWITLTAYDGRKIHLEKTKSGQPIATMTINGKYCQLEHIWVYADESGTWPKVIHVDLHGKDMVTGKAELERINNK